MLVFFWHLWAVSLEGTVCPAQAEPFVLALGETMNPTLNFLSFEARCVFHLGLVLFSFFFSPSLSSLVFPAGFNKQDSRDGSRQSGIAMGGSTCTAAPAPKIMSCHAKANALHCFLSAILSFRLFFKGFLLSLGEGAGAGGEGELAGLFSVEGRVEAQGNGVKPGSRNILHVVLERGS